MVKCAIEGCGEPTKGKSKYCVEHARIAREKVLELFKTKKAEKEARYACFAKILAEAEKLGYMAGRKIVPEPMTVVERAGLSMNAPIVKVYKPIADGVCGFAWVVVKSGSTSFARWLQREGKSHKRYHGGVSIWVRDHNQSYTRKMAHAEAMADYLNEHIEELGNNLTIFAGGRLD